MSTLGMALCGLAAVVSTSAFAANRSMPVEGSTSQPIGHYDFCKRYAEECGTNAEVGVTKLTKATWEKIVEVNDAVNISIFPRTDEEMHGVPEYWSYPRTEGDCEDYALLKQYMLERAGFLRSALLITVVRQPNGDGHAVLTVRTDKGDFILDNLEEGVLDWKQTQYRYLKRQSEKNSAKWVGIADDRDVLVGSVR
ncbi:MULTISPECIES: transglutaminase-like cysteine peptidase [unclassified Aureimonas]|uniref:transglutaminase-like cysteine peptidase n=1 Tax=unclassified Aureimonas TaxID=2615206 RepID=UPI001FCDC1A0|nr:MULTISPECIES: transglutaminase-like cysteine peptidase [unclassified Aureimonas]